MRLPLFVAFALALLLAACASAPSAGPDQLLADLRILSADEMEGRGAGTPGGERARAYIVQRYDELELAPGPDGRLQPWSRDTRRGTVAGVNVVGLIEGTRAPDRYIVVTAHYDHLGIHEGEIHNGADDNASGVAAMLELAARLKADPPQHSVLIVALDGEERGLLGAHAFVADPPVPLSAMALNLNLDMLARPDDGHLWVTGTYQHPHLRPVLEPIAAVGGISLRFGKDTPQDLGPDNWVNASDHAAFHARGVPFLYFGVDYHPDYHQPTDVYERITPAAFIAATELTVRGFRALDAALSR